MNTEACLKAVKCPVCKRVFYPSPLWGWTIGERRFCRYSCMRETEKKKKRKAGKTARELNNKRVRMVEAHERPEKINEVSRRYLAALAEEK